jgi:hypothetical protein
LRGIASTQSKIFSDVPQLASRYDADFCLFEITRCHAPHAARLSFFGAAVGNPNSCPAFFASADRGLNGRPKRHVRHAHANQEHRFAVWRRIFNYRLSPLSRQ